MIPSQMFWYLTVCANHTAIAQKVYVLTTEFMLQTAKVQGIV